MIAFNKSYFIFFIILFIAEILIALFAHDNIIRPYGGDMLVVVMLYCLVRSTVNSGPAKTAIMVLVFSYLVELCQYIDIIHHLGLGNSQLANIVLGNSFSWVDILAYTLGALLVIAAESWKRAGINKRTKTLSDRNLCHFL